MERPHLAKWKVFAVWGTFLLLHFSYETFPNVVFKIVGEKGETTFSHMKMLFFAYLFVTGVEFFVRRARIGSPQTFWFARMLIAVVYPWVTIELWFTAEALGLRPSAVLEIVYANVATVIGVYMAVRMEELFAETVFRPSMKATIALAFAAALLAYVSFSFKTPMPFFVTPPNF